jgi:tellurite resistance-related uncharacterized protein
MSALPASSPGAVPHKRTSVFDETTLPAGLRREHRTRLGVWGVIRVLDGRLRYQVLDPASEVILEPGRPGLVLPDEPHLVEPLGPCGCRSSSTINCPTCNGGCPTAGLS